MGRLGALLLTVFFLSFGCTKQDTNSITLTWAVGKDVTGTQKRLAREFMARNPGIRVRIIEMPESASTQRDSYVTYFISRDATVDVYALDITWPAEFAAAQWLLPLDAYFPPSERADFLPGPLEGCTYRGQLYAVPWFTDAGLLYYRSDLLKNEGFAPPATWDERVRQAQALKKKYRMTGFVFQAAQYEGLICNYLEYLWAFGGRATDASGHVTVDTPQAREALRFLYGLIHTAKIAPPEVLTYKEEESRQPFTAGESVFLRNWPYVWKIAQDTATSKVDGRIGISALPGKAPGGGVSCLGGWNLAVSRFSRHPGEAWKLIAFMAAAGAQKEYAIAAGRLPTRASVYKDPAVLAFAPYYKTLYPVFVNARPRPVSPVYARVSDILQIELHRTLTDQQSVEEALRNAQKRIDEVEQGKK